MSFFCDLGLAKEFSISTDNSYQPQEKQFKRFINKINVEKYEGPALPNHAVNQLIESNRKYENERYVMLTSFQILLMYYFKLKIYN